MRGAKRSFLFQSFRTERLLGVWFGLMLLLVPFIHPLAEANAAGRADAAVICSSFGASDDSAIPAQADDCPTGLGCCVAPSQSYQAGELEWTAVAFPQALPWSLAHRREVRGEDLALWSRPPGQGPPAIF